MSSDDLSHEQSLPAITGALNPSDFQRYFSRRSDLTYRRIEDLSVSDVDMYMSMFTGSLIRKCVFQKVLFHRSDLDGIRVEGSTFLDCDFTHCDIRSSVFANCEFRACIFNATFIDDCQLQGCVLMGCSLESASVTHCTFSKCSIATCINITRASFLHNKLYDSVITDLNFGDCTISYIILRQCEVTKISLSAECIGGIFGITRDQLDQLTIFYLGEPQPVPPESDLLNMVYDEYQQRKWYLGLLVLSINFELVSAFQAYETYLNSSYKRFVEFGFAKGDELEFIGDLLEELAVLDRLPFLTSIRVLEWCTELESAIQHVEGDLPESSGDPLRTFASRATLLTNKLLDKLDRAIPPITLENDRTICIEATFNQEPTVSLTDLINLITGSTPIPVLQRSQLIRVSKGSYVEIVLTTLLSFVALQVLLFLINGCIIQLTELRHRLKVLADKKAPKTYLELVLSPTQLTSPLILSVLPGLVSAAKGLPWIKEVSLGGYLTSNVKSVHEVDCDDCPSEVGDSSRPNGN